MSKEIIYFKQILIMIFLLELGACNNTSAQFYGGCSLGLVQNKIVDTYHAYDNNLYRHNTGVSAQIKFGYNLNQKLKIESGLRYQTKNYEIYRNAFFQGTSSRFINSYMHLPLILQIEILNWHRFNLSARLGGYTEYWLKRAVNSTMPNILAPKDIADDQSYYNIYQLVSRQTITENRSFQQADKRVQCGLVLGSSIRYSISGKNSLFLEPEFQSTLTGVEKEYQKKQSIKRNQAVIFSIGVNHNL